MNDKQKDLTKLLEGYFGVKVAKWHTEEEFNAAGIMRASGNNLEKSTTTFPEEHFLVFNFTDEKGDWYKLVEYDGNFQEDKELVSFMRDAEETIEVDEYRLVQPKSHIENYTLYFVVETL
jgi:hypothetical protein